MWLPLKAVDYGKYVSDAASEHCEQCHDAFAPRTPEGTMRHMNTAVENLMSGRFILAG